jgi:hypothetical protein
MKDVGLIGFYRKPVRVLLEDVITYEEIDGTTWGFVEREKDVKLMQDVEHVIMIKRIEDTYYINLSAMRTEKKRKTFEIITSWQMKANEIAKWLIYSSYMNVKDIYIGHNCESIVDGFKGTEFENDMNFYSLDTIEREFGVIQRYNKPNSVLESSYKEAITVVTKEKTEEHQVSDNLTFNIDCHKKYTLTYITGKRQSKVYKTKYYSMKVRTDDLIDLVTLRYVKLLEFTGVDKMDIVVRGYRKTAMRLLVNTLGELFGERPRYRTNKEMWELLIDKV